MLGANATFAVLARRVIKLLSLRDAEPASFLSRICVDVTIFILDRLSVL